MPRIFTEPIETPKKTLAEIEEMKLIPAYKFIDGVRVADTESTVLNYRIGVYSETGQKAEEINGVVPWPDVLEEDQEAIKGLYASCMRHAEYRLGLPAGSDENDL